MLRYVMLQVRVSLLLILFYMFWYLWQRVNINIVFVLFLLLKYVFETNKDAHKVWTEDRTQWSSCKAGYSRKGCTDTNKSTWIYIVLFVYAAVRVPSVGTPIRSSSECPNSTLTVAVKLTLTGTHFGVPTLGTRFGVPALRQCRLYLLHKMASLSQLSCN